MISYYELLGLIKEGKQPDKVKYDNNIYEWNGYNHMYETSYITSYLCERSMFDRKIEIIEEKSQQIAKIDTPEIDDIKNERICRAEHKINDLIDRVNYLLGEDKHE